MNDTLDADVMEFLDRYVRNERRLAENTRLTYARGLSRFMEFVRAGGIVDYLHPQSAEVARYLESLCGQGLSPATRQITVSAQRLFYRRLAGRGRLSAAAARPITELAAPQVPERLPNVLSVEEVQRLLESPVRACPHYWLYKSVLEFLYGSGCRASEATDLLLADVDLEAGTARVAGKGGKERLVLFGAPAAQALGGYIHLLRPEQARRRSDPPPWLFLSRTGRQLSRTYLWKLVNAHAEKAKLPAWVGPHSLRHACATHLIRGGSDVRFVQTLLGHANVQVTTVYLNLDVTDLRRAHERLMTYREPVETPTSLPGEGVSVRLARHDAWSAEEDELVRTRRPSEVVQRTGRTLIAVYERRGVLGVTIKRQGPPRAAGRPEPWSAEEDAMLQTLTAAEIARLTGRTCEAVYGRRRKLGATVLARWTEEENQLVLNLPVAEAALHCGRSLRAVQQQRYLLRRRHRPMDPGGETVEAPQPET